jgi:YesN/AraC family two-component response regulator
MASVLIVDDDLGTRQSISALLTLEGHETATAETGNEGIAIAIARSFDAILVDLRLPDLSGVEVVRRLKSLGVVAPVVVMTVFPDLDSSFDAGSVGAAGYVDAPLFGDEAVNVVGQVLQGRCPVRHPDCAVPPRPRAHGHATEAVRRSPGLDPRLRDLFYTIDSNPNMAASLERLASRMRMSESRLRHLFKSFTGMRISEFVTGRRLFNAAARLTRTSEPIRQISRSLAWTSERGFRQNFRRKFGMSPTEYRNRFSR